MAAGPTYHESCQAAIRKRTGSSSPRHTAAIISPAISSRTTSGWVVQSSSSQAARKASPIAAVASGVNAPCSVKELTSKLFASAVVPHTPVAKWIQPRSNRIPINTLISNRSRAGCFRAVVPPHDAPRAHSQRRCFPTSVWSRRGHYARRLVEALQHDHANIRDWSADRRSSRPSPHLPATRLRLLRGLHPIIAPKQR